MKNPFKNYIDKRIRNAFEEKERQASKEKYDAQCAINKQKIEEKQKKQIDNIVRALISNGSYNLITPYNCYGSYVQKEITSYREEIRKTIMQHIIKSLFKEEYGDHGRYTTFSLSEGLKQDLQKLYNIKPKTDEKI